MSALTLWILVGISHAVLLSLAGVVSMDDVAACLQVDIDAEWPLACQAAHFPA